MAKKTKRGLEEAEKITQEELPDEVTKTLGQLHNSVCDDMIEIAKIQKKADGKKSKILKRINENEAKVASMLESLDLEEFKTLHGKAKRVSHVYSKTVDYAKFWKWVKKTDAQEYISKSIPVGAFRASLKKDFIPPGLEAMEVYKTVITPSTTLKAKRLAPKKLKKKK